MGLHPQRVAAVRPPLPSLGSLTSGRKKQGLHSPGGLDAGPTVPRKCTQTATRAVKCPLRLVEGTPGVWQFSRETGSARELRIAGVWTVRVRDQAEAAPP